jgi:hypothetical protein
MESSNSTAPDSPGTLQAISKYIRKTKNVKYGEM